MKIIHSFGEADKNEELSLAFGYFDGIHLGHRKIIEEENKTLKNGVVTFDRHPLDLIDKSKAPKRLMTLDEKISYLEKLNVDYLFIIHFDFDFMNLTDREFINMVIDNVNMKKMKVGFNYHFGKNGMGNADMLKEISKEKDFDLKVVEEYKIGNERVCSTAIRRFISDGNIKKANEFLGRAYSVEGKVSHGKHLGKKIGIPTANIIPDAMKIMPKRGVYVTRVTVDGNVHYGISNVGINPTFNEEMKIETNIFDFDKDIYGKSIKIEFLEFEREERAFDSIEDLKETINKSISFGKDYIKGKLNY
ncbi:bifunctional riboflavin kinase/FAD synthetase [Anaerofustis sp.]|uniref:bifunctional riboflavin kinase/FAD synthetase n=1 Tax=Anaerofustis sp. TaxID=1872517 RepID=UPI0025BE44BF|nr:bifunctional riboflavin kinase/FAD synthetase [Anaerofustis sp.]